MIHDDLDAVRAKLRGVKGSGDSFTALCPAHDDHTRSLSVSKGRTGTVLLKCHTGCTFREINDALDGAASTPRKQHATGPTTEREAAIYVYTDANEAPLFQVVRYDVLDHEGARTGKTFKQRRHIGGNDYAFGMKGTTPVLYRLPAIIEAVACDRTVYVVEGEKDADRLAALGLDATTNVTGAAAAWRDSYSEVLRGADVVILPDNDEPGRKHAQKVALALHGIARAVRTVELPGLEPKGDVSDWLDAGNTTDDLRRLLTTALPEPAAPASRFRLYTDAELDALPPPVPLVEGTIFADTLVALVGKFDSYKTFVLLDLALCIGVGADWHGRRVRQGSVVYVYAEGTSGIGPRVKGWKAAMGYSGGADVYFLPTAVMLTDPAQVAELLAVIAARCPKPAAVFVDTLARNMDGDENSTQDMGRFVQGCDTIRRETGATVIVAHHMGWSADRSRGSVSLPGALHTEVTIARDDAIVTLKCTKQKDAAPFPDITLEAVPSVGSLALRPVAPHRPDLTTNERLALTEVQASGDVSASRWEDATGLAKASFHNARRRLLALVYVKRTPKGYAATEAGAMALSARCTTGATQVQIQPVSEVQTSHTPKGVSVAPDLALPSPPILHLSSRSDSPTHGEAA